MSATREFTEVGHCGGTLTVTVVTSSEGIGTEDEDLGNEGPDGGGIKLPSDMVDKLRVDLAVWRPSKPG